MDQVGDAAVIDLSSQDAAGAFEAALRRVAERHQERFEAVLDATLGPAERVTQRFVQGLGYAEGAWYRPAHNVVVPAAMLAIISTEGCARDLLLAAQLHDVGYSVLRVAQASRGASWEGTDARVAHMARGADLARGHLHTLAAASLVELTAERVERLASIVATHDDPYMGRELDDPEARLVRSADRVFVPSALSYYKDFIAMARDPRYAALRRDRGHRMSPRFALRARLAFFFAAPSSLPKGWDEVALPLDPALAVYNERGEAEPCYTIEERDAVGRMLRARASELEQFERARSVADLEELVESAYADEMGWLLERATRRGTTNELST